MIASIRARLRAWWHRHIVADEDTSRVLAQQDMEMRMREGRLP